MGAAKMGLGAVRDASLRFGRGKMACSRSLVIRLAHETESDYNPPLGGTDSLIEGMRSTKDDSGAC
jgi:hypothetical protein